MTVTIQTRRDTAANWTAADPTLAVGEMGLETDTQRYKVGDGVTAWSSLGYWEPQQILIVDKKAYNVAGGTFTGGADRTRDLTDIIIDTGNNVTLVSNQVTLANGIYRILHISAPAYRVEIHQVMWATVSGAPAITVLGTSLYAWSSGVNNTSFIINEIFISNGQTFELKHRCGATFATQGFGVATGITGRDNIYSVVNLERIG